MPENKEEDEELKYDAFLYGTERYDRTIELDDEDDFDY